MAQKQVVTSPTDVSHSKELTLSFQSPEFQRAGSGAGEQPIPENWAGEGNTVGRFLSWSPGNRGNNGKRKGRGNSSPPGVLPPEDKTTKPLGL